MKIIKLLILSIFLLTFGLSKSQTTVTVGGGATITCPATPTATWTTPPTGISFSNWSRGSGVTCVSANDGLSGSGFNTASAAASYSANKYYTVTITADATHTFTLNSITWLTTISSGGGTFNIQYINNGGSLTSFGTTNQTNTSSNTFSGSVSVAAGTSIVLYLIPSGTGAAGTTLRWLNGSTINITTSGSVSTYTGLILSEVSQGESGFSREYIEMMAIGSPCTTIDIRNWIIDDNNGIFSGGRLSNRGITRGYIRFSLNNFWSTVPTGTIILIYNGSDTCRSITTYFDNDASDFKLTFPIINTDSTYFIGNNLSPNTTSSLYTSTRTYPNWASISLNNNASEGDGVQIRSYDTTFYHGIGFGNNQTTHPDIPTYGSSALLFGSGTGGANQNYYISDTISNFDFKNKFNWSNDTGYITRTPGIPNNNKIIEWMKYLTCSTLPIEISQFYTICNDDNTSIYFSTLSQVNVDYFYLQKSRDGSNWVDFAWFKGKENSSQLDEYRATDDSKYKYYYRIKEVDLDGTIIYSKMIYSSCLNTDNNTTDIKIINNNILNIQTNSNEKLILSLYSVDGKLIKSDIIKNSSQIELETLSRGIYITSLISESGQINIVKKILIK